PDGSGVSGLLLFVLAVAGWHAPMIRHDASRPAHHGRRRLPDADGRGWSWLIVAATHWLPTIRSRLSTGSLDTCWVSRDPGVHGGEPRPGTRGTGTSPVATPQLVTTPVPVHPRCPGIRSRTPLHDGDHLRPGAHHATVRPGDHRGTDRGRGTARP